MAEKMTGSREEGSSDKARLNGHTFTADTMRAATTVQDQVGTGSLADEIDPDNDGVEGEPLTAGEIRYRQHQQHLEKKKKVFLRKYDVEPEQVVRTPQ